jgi:hypothetical protein
MSETAQFTRALFRIMTGPDKDKPPFPVHFNPTSLSYVITNTLAQQEKSTQQYVSQSTGKLTLDLVFDTTHDGQDVRSHTVKVAKLMKPNERIPAVVKFEWGAYSFQGVVEGYKETIDFFSPDGVPLRATLNLTLSSQSEVFAGGDSNGHMQVGGSLTAEPLELFVPKPLERKPRGSPSDVAARAGAPGAARDIAVANGSDTLRFAKAGPLTVSATSAHAPAVGFGGSSAPPRAERTSARADLQKLSRPEETSGPTDGRGAGFIVGGEAKASGAASLRSDVGSAASLRARIHFPGG